MAYAPVLTGLAARDAAPRIRHITPVDLKDALLEGLADFSAMPSHAVFLCLIYPIIGLVLAQVAFGYAVLPLIYPLLGGFALVGPLAAIGLYELSRRREQGHQIFGSEPFELLRSDAIGPIAQMGAMLVMIFFLWLVVAQGIYWMTFGDASPPSIASFLREVFTTPAGWTLIIVGNGVGFLFAVAVLMLSVVAFPLLIDRRISAADAMLTSVRAVLANPATMALWGLIVAAGLVIGSLPLLLGLTVVLPVLGHATWHLYRKVIEPDQHAEYQPVPHHKSRRYAADFPAALFPTREDEP